MFQGKPPEHAWEASTSPLPSRPGGFVRAVLWGPPLIYVASLWVLVPAPFPYATPLLLLFAPLFVLVSRGYALDLVARLGLEFSLLLFMALLAALSMQNAEEPFRAFRVLFPCLVPFLIFPHFLAMGSVSPEHPLACVRALLAGAFVFSALPFFASYALPPLKSIVWETYRLRSLFQISIQHGIAVSMIMPLMVAEILAQPNRVRRLVGLGLFLMLAYIAFRAGSKTSMSLGFGASLVTYAVLQVRRQSALRSVGMVAGLGLVGAFLYFFGLDIAEKLEPETGAKLRDIVDGGAKSYQSVQVRRNLWQLSIEAGKEHWLVGAGAGKVLMSYPHSHNLVIDYFKGIGLFGALAITALCLVILARAGRWMGRMLRHGGDATDARIFACYMAAVVYVLANQMSDSFGPSTIGFLWTVYLAAVVAAHGREQARRTGADPRA